MTDTITIQVPIWLALVFIGLFGVHGAMELYVWHLKRKIAELDKGTPT